MPENIRVLLVDDQPIINAVVKDMLLSIDGLEYHYCQESKKALSTALEFKPTVILQDIEMPEIDGLMLVKLYRANSILRHVPVMVLSSLIEPDVKVKAFDNGANDYMEKKFDLHHIQKELIARVKYHSKAYNTLLERNKAYDDLNNEIKKAADFIHRALPEEIDSEILRAKWCHIPSTTLSGDTFDYRWLDDEHFMFYIIDVCGHGVKSALHTISALNFLRSAELSIDELVEPKKLFHILNEDFQMSNHDGLYFAIWYGVLNTKTRQLKYAGSGHPPALLLTDGKIEKLSSNNFIVGGLPEFDFKEDTIEIKSNSNIFLYSDGAYEVIDKSSGEMWEFVEFEHYIQKNNSITIFDDLYKHLQALGGKKQLDDDFTMLQIGIS